jgi:hypothetical protein
VIGTIEERKGILPSTFNINMYNTIIGPQPTASSYRLYNTQAKNAYRNAFREVVKKKMRLERQNQGSASIFPRQELTRHGDRRPPYPLFLLQLEKEMEEMWSSAFAPEYWFGGDRGMVWRIL